jgi:hypothetical protein
VPLRLLPQGNHRRWQAPRRPLHPSPKPRRKRLWFTRAARESPNKIDVLPVSGKGAGKCT